MKKNLEVSDEIKELAEEVIREEDVFLGVTVPKIAYLMVDPFISRTVVGRCTKSNEKLKFFTDFDYVIEISKKAWDLLKTETKKILLYHELLHINITQNEKTGEWVYKVIDHDLKDFKVIVNKYGTDWFKTEKMQLADTLKLKAAEIDAVEL